MYKVLRLKATKEQVDTGSLCYALLSVLLFTHSGASASKQSAHYATNFLRADAGVCSAHEECATFTCGCARIRRAERIGDEFHWNSFLSPSR